MRLQACPICALVELIVGDDLCVPVIYEGQKAVVLRHHSPNPSPATMKKAFELLGTLNGNVREIEEVPGHWGLVVVPGDWLGVESKATARRE